VQTGLAQQRLRCARRSSSGSRIWEYCSGTNGPGNARSLRRKISEIRRTISSSWLTPRRSKRRSEVLACQLKQKAFRYTATRKERQDNRHRMAGQRLYSRRRLVREGLRHAVHQNKTASWIAGENCYRSEGSLETRGIAMPLGRLATDARYGRFQSYMKKYVISSQGRLPSFFMQYIFDNEKTILRDAIDLRMRFLETAKRITLDGVRANGMVNVSEPNVYAFS